MENSRIRRTIFKCFDILWPHKEGITANNIIADGIKSGKPLMVARFGAVEIKGVLYGVMPPPNEFAL